MRLFLCWALAMVVGVVVQVVGNGALVPIAMGFAWGWVGLDVGRVWEEASQ